MAPAMMLTTSLFPLSTHSKTTPKNSRFGSALGNAILASLLLVLLPSLALAYPDEAPELCVVRALDARHVSPWLSETRRTPGCSSHGQLSPKGAEVHVLRALLNKGGKTSRPLPLPSSSEKRTPVDLVLDTAANNNSAPSLVLLLSSDRPVLWRISGRGLSRGAPHTVLACKECQVKSELALQLEDKEWPGKKEQLLRFAKKEWGGITSFTEVRGANRIELTVGFSVPGDHSVECDTNSNQISPVASAAAVLPEQAFGCYNGHLLGSSTSDVYIVEIAQKDLIRHADNGSSAPVQVNLQGEGAKAVQRNITLFLKAHRPTRWQLRSHGIDGKIVVISNQQVENLDVGKKQSIEVRNMKLPDRMDALLLATISYGPLVLYARTERASRLDVKVASSKEAAADDEQLSGDMAGEDKIADSSSLIHPQQVTVQHSLLRSTATSNIKSADSRHLPMDDLRREMVVSCEPKRMNISFPKSLTEKLGVRSILLNNPLCKPESNSTHIWLTTFITSCNTLSSSENEKTVYSNAVHVKFGTDDRDGVADYEEIEDEDKKLPVVCKYLSKFPGMIVVAYGGEDIEEEPSERHEGPSSSSSNGNSLYMMELYKDRNHTDVLSFYDDDPAEISYDNKIFVRTWIESVLPIQVVPEMCWLSNVSDYKSSKASRVYLVKKACSTELSVEIEDYYSERSQNQHGGFTFKVNRAYSEMNLLYLHCALGLCTRKPEHARGNLFICANQAQNCFRGGPNHLASTAQQVVTRGPIKPVPRKPKVFPPQVKIPTESVAAPMGPAGLPGFESMATRSPSVQHTPGPDTRSTSVTHGSISTEMAAVIALVAFMVGVVVTGSMWFIHIKTDPYRNGRKGLHQAPLAAAAQQQRSSPALGLNGQQQSSSVAI